MCASEGHTTLVLIQCLSKFVGFLDGKHKNAKKVKATKATKTSPDFQLQNHEIIDPYLLSHFCQSFLLW